MIINFNSNYIANKNLNNPNFKALNVNQIIKDEFEAENFVYDVLAKKKITKSNENIIDLKKAINQAISEGKKIIAFKLNKVAKEWGISQ